MTAAQHLITCASLGALVAYSDGWPRPSARFKRKLAEWRRFNGVGRLDSVTPAERHGAHEVPARFVLHVGDFGSFGAIVLTVRMCFDTRSPLTFTVIDAAPGSVVGFVTDGVHLELAASSLTRDRASLGSPSRATVAPSSPKFAPRVRFAGCRRPSPPSRREEDDHGLLDRRARRSPEASLA